MRQQYIRTKFIIGIFLMGWTSFSCKKFVQIPEPVNRISTPAVFADSADAGAAIIGLYINAMGSYGIPVFLHGGITYSTALTSDELSFTPGSQTGNQFDQEFYSNAISPKTNQISNSFWIEGYNLIYSANACMEGVMASNGISASTKNTFSGEAKFMRALCYFNLVNLYGPVPLITTTDYKRNAILGRTSVDSVYAQIVGDLTEAQLLLPDVYPSSGRARANKAAATALLAKVYLYLKQWNKAEEMATLVIGNTNYDLEQDLSSVFLTGSKEAILQMSPTIEGYETIDGFMFVPTDPSVIPSYIVDSSLLASFEPDDLRRDNWLNNNVVDNVAYYYPYKYKLGYDGSSSPQEMYMILRLGEVYLIRAEARAQQPGKANDAISDLNAIRHRAGLDPTPSVTQEDVLNDIYHERQVELFCENGNRWFDLKRTGRIDQVMNGTAAWKGVPWDPNHQYFPIPFQEMQYNPFLTQNNGYN
jgi:hypothetical protein